MTVAERRFRFRHAVDVRFRDVDAMGHAHHTFPLIAFEEARAAYWREVAGRETIDGIDYVLADVAVAYHARITFPARLSVECAVVQLGNSSFVMEYAVRSDADELLASGRTTQVLFDYAAGRSKPIPAALRERLETFERGGAPAA